jgi:hypothetical protein
MKKEKKSEKLREKICLAFPHDDQKGAEKV